MRILIFMTILYWQIQTKPFYEIVAKEKDNRGLVNQLYIYTPKISDVKAINNIVWSKYKNIGIVLF